MGPNGVGHMVDQGVIIIIYSIKTNTSLKKVKRPNIILINHERIDIKKGIFKNDFGWRSSSRSPLLRTFTELQQSI